MRIMNVKPAAFVAQLRCDRCGLDAQHDVGDGFNNFVQIGFDAGWGSALGDGNRIDIDLCHGCLKTTLGPWLRISSSDGTALGIDAPGNNAACECAG